MDKILTICIPTYKRPSTLRCCVDSIVAQINEFKLSDSVGIYVANDASPDNTDNILCEYAALDYFNSVTRNQNQGMNINIRLMLSEVLHGSKYQLIITDDDYLQPHVLPSLVEFLHTQQNEFHGMPAIWTPRYSYTENGNLHCIVCNPFTRDTLINPSAFNAGKYMHNGFVLSGLIVSAESIDFESWKTYSDNAYFPMIFFGGLIAEYGAYYFNCNIVHHTVFNKCHWEDWGRSDLLIEIKKFSDALNAYRIVAQKINSFWALLNFYFASFPSISTEIYSFLGSNNLKASYDVVRQAIQEQKVNEVFRLTFPLREQVLCSWIATIFILIAKITVLQLFTTIVVNTELRNHYKEKKYVCGVLLTNAFKTIVLLY